MPEVILIKEPAVFRRKLFSKSVGERVVGLTVPGAPTLTEYNEHPSSNAKEEALNVNQDMADRLKDFYERCLAGPPDTAPFYDCHMFAWYIMGVVTEFKPYAQYCPQPYSDEVTSVKPGRIYSIIDKQGLGQHSMTGTERPEYSLSVLGLGAPLTVAHNDTLMELYKGETIFEFAPESIF